MTPAALALSFVVAEPALQGAQLCAEQAASSVREKCTAVMRKYIQGVSALVPPERRRQNTERAAGREFKHHSVSVSHGNCFPGLRHQPPPRADAVAAADFTGAGFRWRVKRI